MKRTAMNSSSAGSAHHHWDADVLSITALCGVVGQDVKAAGDEVYELHLGYWPHAHHCRAACGADDCAFGDWRVYHSIFAEACKESFGHLEGAAVGSDIFTEEEDAFIALHFFPQSLFDCLQQRHSSHCFS